MANTIDQIAVDPNGVILVREITDAGGYHRSSFYPGQDVSDQPQEVKDACANAWTPEVIAAYEAQVASFKLGA